MIPTHIITSDVNLDHLIQVVSTELLHGKIMISSFHNYLKSWREIHDAMQIPTFSSNFRSLIVPSSSEPCLLQFLLWYLPNGDLMVPSFFLYLLTRVIL